MIGSILSALGGLFGVIKGLFGWLERKEQQRVGKLDAENKTLKREARRAKGVRKIQKDVAGMSPDALGSELRGDVPKGTGTDS